MRRDYLRTRNNEQQEVHMKSVVYNRLGSPAEVLELVERDAPAPGPGELRVEVLSSPIHNADLLQIAGLYGRSPRLPATPGSEAVGRVLERGEGLTQPAIGATVFISSGATWTQQLTVPAKACIPLPPGDVDQFAMLVSSPATALLLLDNYVTLNKGDWLIQTAGNSAVGSAVIQLAKARGIRTLNIVRRKEVASELERLGADVVLVGTDDLVARIDKATGGATIPLALDAIGGPVFKLLVNALGMGGTLVSYSQVVAEPVAIAPADLIFKQVSLRGFWLSQWFQEASDSDKQALFGQLLPLIASGKLRLAVDSTYPLDQVAEAVARSAGGRRNGKVMLHPNP